MSAARLRSSIVVLVGAVALGTLPQVMLASRQAAPEPKCAYTWVGREAELEEFLRTAEITKMTDVPVGVTKPRRAYLAAGGPVESMAWKPLTPSRATGFLESYKSEIAAYELDKLLGMHMVPPTVERKIDGRTGAAIMWVTPTQSFKEMGGVPQYPKVPGVKVGPWTRQLARAKMFDNLIANIDPNLGNWLADPDWHLILIDHSRSFAPGKNLAHKMENIDRELWERMQKLDEPTLTQALGQWLDKDGIKGVLDRRAAMEKEVEKLVKAKGDAAFLK